MQDHRIYSDAHCHVPFMADPASFARRAYKAGAAVFAVTISPFEYRCFMRRDPALRHLSVGLGLHPWWVPSDAAALDDALRGFDDLFDDTRFIGEVGLDYSPRCAAAKDHQLRAMSYIVDRCAQHASSDAPSKGKVLSIHCVRAYDDMLSLLDRSGCAAGCDCIFHWFSGSFSHLQHAIRLGCYFSVSERMLASKRGREYAKVVPRDRLLLETDAPFVADPLSEHPAVAYTYEAVAEELARTAGHLAELRGEALDSLARVLAGNAAIFSDHC